MRVPIFVCVLFFLLPAAAQASQLQTVSRERMVEPGTRVLNGDAPRRFNLVGVSWRGEGSVWLRTRSTAGRWTGWRPAAPEAEDVPDGRHAWRYGNPYWTGPSTAVRYRFRGRVTRLRANFVWSVADAVPLRTLSLAGAPAIVPRVAWAGSETALRRGSPRFATTLRFAVVHHTAGASSYSRAQSPAIVRAVAAYHVRSNGWDDVGYNFLIDRFGQIFEGRYGGTTRNVIGAHAQGFNTGSVGVALIGTYTSTTPPAAARTALASLLAWRLDVAHVDPLSTLTHHSAGNPKYAAGIPVLTRAISGHRDTGFTSCPGDRLYAQLPAVARSAAGQGLPKLYAPVVRGAPGGLVRFTARLSGALPWTVTVSDDAGGVLASGAGSGAVVDWTWDARLAPAARYRWIIGAGPSVRPATGVFSGGSAALTLTAAATPATISPDGDGQADYAVVRYTLGRSASVTAVLADAAGGPLATIVEGVRPTGTQTFRWSADGLADGAYQLIFTAQSGGRQVVFMVPIAVNRTLTRLMVNAPSISPNGDGRFDTAPFAFALTVPAEVVVEAQRTDSAPVTVYAAPLGAGEHSLVWNGEAAPGIRAADGVYSLVVTAVNAVGTVAQASPLTVDTLAPRLRIVSKKPLRVRVSEPATLRMTADGLATNVLVQRAGVVRIARAAARIWAVAEDRAGNRSRALRLR